MLQRKTLIFCGSCLTDGYFSLHRNALDHRWSFPEALCLLLVGRNPSSFIYEVGRSL